MSGWIRVEKDLVDSIRFRRMVKTYRSNALRDVTESDVTRDVTLLLGALVRLWMYADSHIRDDNRLAIRRDEIDEIVGVQGFADSLPGEWLQIIDPENAELPDFLEHNGTSARERKAAAKRQADYRNRHKSRIVTRDVTHSNVHNAARPDQTRPEETRPDQKEESARAVVGNTPTAENVKLDELAGPEVDREAINSWREYRTSIGMMLKPFELISIGKLLASMGSPASQRAAVHTAIGNGWKNLRQGDGRNGAGTGGDADLSAIANWKPKPEPLPKEPRRAKP
jgi:hypothetical protein